jgi:hypothetical protein
LDELQKQYDDPVAHFREAARRMTEEENAKNNLSVTLNMNEVLAANTDDRKNFGYAAILKIYHELGLNRFFNSKARHENFEFNTDSIMLLLVVSRLLSPGSKKKAFEEKGRYFERFDFSQADIYRALSHYADISVECQRHIRERIAKRYGSDTSIVYYDVTNFYFEIDKADDFRKHQKSKENRHNPIVQMGLAADADGVPICYETFPGNTADSGTFRTVIGDAARNCDANRIVVVADMGIITGDNIYYLKGGDKDKNRNGYVFAFSVRGGTDDFKAYVLAGEGYLCKKNGKPVKADNDDGIDFKIKSRRIAREINVTMQSGRTAKKIVYEKQLVFWSKKYADKAAAERDELVKKAAALVADPSKYTKAVSYGAAKYVTNLEFDKKTGKLTEAEKGKPALDSNKANEEAKYDGYYSIVTSELHMSDDEIISAYRGLWEIEESFRITKGTLEARPVYVSREDRIRAHFLTCFIALVIARLLQKLTDKRYSCDKITACLNKISCSPEQENIYLFDYRSEVSDAVGKATGIDFTKKRLRLAEIKGVLAESKRRTRIDKH